LNIIKRNRKAENAAKAKYAPPLVIPAIIPNYRLAKTLLVEPGVVGTKN
jgi:hypothetical protein